MDYKMIHEMGGTAGKSDAGASGSKTEEGGGKPSVITTIVSVISTTFTPVIPALIGGMIKAVLSILVLCGLDDSSSTYALLI